MTAQVDYQPLVEIPGLAWCLRARNGTALVLHGPLLETGPDFFADGVWAGDFGSGRLGESFCCGTGATVSDGVLKLVSASSPFDRIFTARIGRELFASNSLPFFLAMVDDSLDDDWLFYRSQTTSVRVGMRIARRTFPTKRGLRVRVLLGETATVEPNGHLSPQLRPLEDEFRDFSHYRSTLAETAAALIENGGDGRRKTPLQPVTALSSGYDSSAIAVVVKEAGGSTALTMMRWSDDGELLDHPGTLATQLGLDLQEFARDAWRSRTDLPDAEVAAAATGFIDIPLIAFEDALPGKLLFVGNGGDSLWTREDYRTYRDVVRTDTDPQGLSEYRLRTGFAVCLLAHVGATCRRSLHRIANSADMLIPFTQAAVSMAYVTGSV